MPICKLCGNERQLIQAHIIPRSFWNIQRQGEEPLAILSSRPGWRPIRSPIGEYDSNILCAECDNKLGVFDQHAFENLVQACGTPFQREGKTIGFVYPNADPLLVQKFVISLVWRASVSQRDYFSRIVLGPYEEVYRGLIVSEAVQTSPVSTFVSEFDQRDAAFLNPQYSRLENVKFAIVFANRFTFYSKVDQQALPNIFSQFEIESGKSVISVVREWEGSKQQNAMRQLVQQNPRPRFWS